MRHATKQHPLSASGHPLVGGVRLVIAMIGFAAFATPVLGQDVRVEVSANQLVSGGDGVGPDCDYNNYTTGLGARLAVPIASSGTDIEITARGYQVKWGPTCVTDLFPPTGPVVELDGLALHSTRFISTDVRIRRRLGGGGAPALSVGIGHAWRMDRNLPYGLVGIQIPIVSLGKLRISGEGELQAVRVTRDEYLRTYESFVVVREEFLGRRSRWSRAVSLGLVLGVPLR